MEIGRYGHNLIFIRSDRLHSAALNVSIFLGTVTVRLFVWLDIQIYRDRAVV